MIATNPYELFSPVHLAWLYRHYEKKLDVTGAELDSIEADIDKGIAVRRAGGFVGEYFDHAVIQVL